jgi:hypothetical protein
VILKVRQASHNVGQIAGLAGLLYLKGDCAQGFAAYIGGRPLEGMGLALNG